MKKENENNYATNHVEGTNPTTASIRPKLFHSLNHNNKAHHWTRSRKRGEWTLQSSSLGAYTFYNTAHQSKTTKPIEARHPFKSAPYPPTFPIKSVIRKVTINMIVEVLRAPLTLQPSYFLILKNYVSIHLHI